MGSRTAKGHRVNYTYMYLYIISASVHTPIYIIPAEAGKGKLEPAEDKAVYFVSRWCEWAVEMLRA